jgi:hypothetical protein
MNICTECGSEYDRAERARSKVGGRITICEECAEEAGDIEKYTGCMIYGHKTAGALQINSDKKLTEFLIKATRLKNKGSNMNDNTVQCSRYRAKTTGACVVTADAVDYKNRSGI